jgi:hypothetical protein
VGGRFLHSRPDLARDLHILLYDEYPCFSLRSRGRDTVLTNNPHLEPTLRMTEPIFLVPIFAYITCCREIFTCYEMSGLTADEFGHPLTGLFYVYCAKTPNQLTQSPTKSATQKEPVLQSRIWLDTSTIFHQSKLK